MKRIVRGSMALCGLVFAATNARALTFSINAGGDYVLNASNNVLGFTSLPGDVTNIGGTTFTQASATFTSVGTFPGVWSGGTFTLSDGALGDQLDGYFSSIYASTSYGMTTYYGGVVFDGGAGKYANWTGAGTHSGVVVFSQGLGSLSLGGTAVPEPVTLILGAAAFALGVGRRRRKA